MAGPAVGLASGLVETMREIGGAVGIAAVTTVLVAGTRDSIELAGPAARQAAAFNGFQSAFIVTVVVAALGALIAGIAFRARQPMPGSPSPRRSRSWLCTHSIILRMPAETVGWTSRRRGATIRE